MKKVCDCKTDPSNAYHWATPFKCPDCKGTGYVYDAEVDIIHNPCGKRIEDCECTDREVDPISTVDPEGERDGR